VSEPARRVRAGRVDDVPAGRLMRLDAEGTPVILVRVGDVIYACGGVCAHNGGPLADGKLTGTRVACPWHGWMYDVRSGECVFPGRDARVPTYRTQVDGADIWVELPAGG
jgi:nitrite reductase (NADH) small subunit